MAANQIPEAVVTDALIADILPDWLIFAENDEHLYHARQRAKTILLETLTAAQQPDHIVDATKMVAQQQGQAVDDHVRRLVGKLDQWRPCMSYNDSYFGEPAGLVKAVSEELARAVDPIYPTKPEPIDPLARVTIHTVTVPLSPFANGRCHCDPSGVDGLTCPDGSGHRLCCNTAPADEPNPPTPRDLAYAEAVNHGLIPPRAGSSASHLMQQRGQALDRMAIRLLVDAGFVTEDKANEALRIAHGFDKGPLAPQPMKQGVVGWCVERPGDPTFPQWDGVRSLIVPASPSAPVGVEAIRQARAIIDHVIHGEPGYELSAAHDLLTAALARVQGGAE